MLSGLSSLLFGSGGADSAAVDQILAGQPIPLDTLETDNEWVLVDAADNEGKSEIDHQSIKEPFSPLESASPEMEVGHGEDEQMENRPRKKGMGNALQQRNAPQTAQAVRANTLEIHQVKLTRSIQRKQHMSKTKQLSRRRLEVNNKAYKVQSYGRKRALACCRVLQPSGQMNGRQSQRNN